MNRRPEIQTIISMSAVALLAVAKIPISREKRLQIAETLISSVYNRALAEALAAAIVDQLTSGEALHRANLLSDISTSEAHQAMHQIEELCK